MTLCPPEVVFMNAAFHLPNRMYYVFLMNSTQQQLDRTMGNVLIYATLELLSLIGLSVVLQRKLRLATIHQLAFVLEKNWVGVQSRLVFWVVYLVGGSLVHYGMSPVVPLWLSSGPLNSCVMSNRRRFHVQVCLAACIASTDVVIRCH